MEIDLVLIVAIIFSLVSLVIKVIDKEVSMLLMFIIIWGFGMTALICVYVLKHSKSCLARAAALAILLLVLVCSFMLLI